MAAPARGTKAPGFSGTGWYRACSTERWIFRYQELDKKEYTRVNARSQRYKGSEGAKVTLRKAAAAEALERMRALGRTPRRLFKLIAPLFYAGSVL